MNTQAAVATIGGNIREARKRAGYETGKAFAEAIGAPPPRISEWETDTYQPTIDTLLYVAKFLRVPIDDLLAGVDEAYEPVRLMSRRDRDMQELPQGGSPNGAVDARVLERLTTEIREEEKALSEVRRLVSELGFVATRRAESLAAALKETARRGSG